MSFRSVILTFCLAPFSALTAQEGVIAPGIHTTRKSEMVLPLPKEEGVFHFLIYGDRTGGPPEGLQILRQAVKDSNMLDPDLVMTVGDLVPGYCAADKWLEDAN
jgi:hypothetical protein